VTGGLFLFPNTRKHWGNSNLIIFCISLLKRPEHRNIPAFSHQSGNHKKDGLSL